MDLGAGFVNVYDDETRAGAYAELEFPGTYYLAFRDLPTILREHVRGQKALDFGCGTGRSTRFLRTLGFDTVGVDVSQHMLAQARKRDPQGDYRLLPDGDLGSLGTPDYDLILSAFTFDNVPTMSRRVALFQSMSTLLGRQGRIVNLVSAAEIYVHEWASFSTKDFAVNRTARTGDRVFIVMLDVKDRRPVEDIFWTDADYREVYRRAGLTLHQTHRPLGNSSEGYAWVSETTVSPWAIYVMGRASESPERTT
jgi:ubiquinone/menaquinone biosynthesis C-methylase UbiE